MTEQSMRAERPGFAENNYDNAVRYISDMSETIDEIIDREGIPKLDFPEDGATKQVLLRKRTKERRAGPMVSTLGPREIIEDPVMLSKTALADGGVEYALSHPENPGYPEYRWSSNGNEIMTTLPEGVDYETAIRNPVEDSDGQPRPFRPLALNEMRVANVMLTILNGSHEAEHGKMTKLRAKFARGAARLFFSGRSRS